MVATLLVVAVSIRRWPLVIAIRRHPSKVVRNLVVHQRAMIKLDTNKRSPSLDTVAPPIKEPEDEVTASTPTQVVMQYISSVGPIDSRLRIIDPSVADGYESCTDLREDILNAVKYLANSIIVSESVPNEW